MAFVDLYLCFPAFLCYITRGYGFFSFKLLCSSVMGENPACFFIEFQLNLTYCLCRGPASGPGFFQMLLRSLFPKYYVTIDFTPPSQPPPMTGSRPKAGKATPERVGMRVPLGLRRLRGLVREIRGESRLGGMIGIGNARIFY